MKKNLFLLFLFSLIVVLACSKSGNTSSGSTSADTTKTTIPTTSIFSNEVATTAYNNFYNRFYNTTGNWFYSTTEKTDQAQGWTQAIFFDMTLDNYARTKASGDLSRVNSFYQGCYNSYSGFNWIGVKYTNGFIYDDMMWWVIALTKAYTITGDVHYLDTAKAGFAFVWNESYDPVNGGMKWSWKVDGKNACINYPTVIAAMMLFNISKDSAYYKKAINIYAWSRINLYDSSNGRVADHKIGNNPAGFEDYTYNQGTCIGAAVLLYKSTGDQLYLNDAKAAADYTKNTMCKNGILPAEGDFNEQGVLKAIFAQYIYSLIYDSGQDQYLDWIKQNITAAWNNRDKVRSLMYRDYSIVCPSGTIQSYEASSGVAFMQLFNPKINDGK